MVNFVNWHTTNQPIKGDVLQMQGNPVANHETPATGVATAVAPIGAQYASVWATVSVTVSVSEVSGAGKDLVVGKTIAIPANTMLEIPNVVVDKSTITMTDI